MKLFDIKESSNKELSYVGKKFAQVGIEKIFTYQKTRWLPEKVVTWRHMGQDSMQLVVGRIEVVWFRLQIYVHFYESKVK